MGTAAFDAIVIGTGQAGPSLATRLAGAGLRVAVIERGLVGGTCVNNGCTPTKTLVASAYAAHLARRAADFGVSLQGPVGVDMKAVKARKDAVVESFRSGVRRRLAETKHCIFFQGHARFESAREVSVGAERLRAERIFLNVGARADIPAMPGIGEIPYLTNVSILELDALPPHLVIIGGSYVGLEFGQMYRRFGARVTIVEMGPRLIQREDEDVSAAIREILEREGVEMRVDAKCIAMEKHADGVQVALDCREGAPRVSGSHVLVATGRRPNTDDLGLEKAGVVTDKRGFISVDDELRTNVPGIWALGDCNGKGAFTHTAYDDYEIVAANLLEGASRRVSERIQTYALFIDPPLGRIGMTDAQVLASGRPALMGKRPMTRVARAIEKGETAGFMKIVVDAQSGKLLGAAILGPGGDEAIHAITDAMYAGAERSLLRRAVHIHPTVAELIPTVLGELTPLK